MVIAMEISPNSKEGPRLLYDVAIVGAGPAGASCAYWLAQAGFNVIVLEKKHFPRDKTCGDGLTPRSVRQLEDMGLSEKLSRHHRYWGLRSVAFGRELELSWPDHPSFPRYGYVIRRAELDKMVADRAREAGATILEGIEVVSATIGEQSCEINSHTLSVQARYLVVADGANSRLGRYLGARRDRSKPMGMAMRGYYLSPRSREQWIESHLDIRDNSGKIVPGYGWIFPMGDGVVNVGVGLLSTNKRWKGTNTSELMSLFLRQVPSSFELDNSKAISPPSGGRLPMGLSILPRAGKRHVLIGDAASTINPFNGEGIAYAYESGRLAASVIAEALSGEGDTALGTYDILLEEYYSSYYRTGQSFMELASNPMVMSTLVRIGMRSPTLMSWVLSIMANLMKDDLVRPETALLEIAASLANARQYLAPRARSLQVSVLARSATAATVISKSSSVWAKLTNKAS